MAVATVLAPPLSYRPPPRPFGGLEKEGGTKEPAGGGGKRGKAQNLPTFKSFGSKESCKDALAYPSLKHPTPSLSAGKRSDGGKPFPPDPLFLSPSSLTPRAMQATLLLCRTRRGRGSRLLSAARRMNGETETERGGGKEEEKLSWAIYGSIYFHVGGKGRRRLPRAIFTPHRLSAGRKGGKENEGKSRSQKHCGRRRGS